MPIYRHLLRPLLFALDGEASHRATIVTSRMAGRIAPVRHLLERHCTPTDPRLRTRVAGLDLASPVGLAAGFDKNAEATAVTSRLGFGFVEVGSVSEHPSPGNPGKPRLWRLPADESLRIYYGCPSDGAAPVAARLAARDCPVPLGVNLVETNTGTMASPAHAAREISGALGRFRGLADYLVLNLACPNMPGGRGLFDDPAALADLLGACQAHLPLPPLFLKITPPGDPTDPRVIDPILEAVDRFDFVRGFILNIPVQDPQRDLKRSAAVLARTRGGITGPALRAPTNAAIAAWYARIDRRRHVLIGTGGIGNTADAYRTIRLGASLVQLYTGLVYEGPGLVRKINDGLAGLLARDGLASVTDAVGLDHTMTGSASRAVLHAHGSVS